MAAKLFRLYGLYGKMDLVWFLRDTKYCLIYMISDLICTLSSIAGIFLLSENFGGFGGMNRQEVLFMLSYATVVNGIYMMFFMGNNTAMVSRIIGRGQLDHSMIQPVPIWLQLLAQGFSPVSAHSTFVWGIGMVVYSVCHLPIAITPGWCVMLAVNAVSSCLIILSAMYLLSCLAFYAPAAAEEIAQSGLDLFSINTYPLGTLGKRARNLFCLFIPIGLTAWLPSQSLLSYGYGRFLPELFAAPAMAAVLLLLTIYFFQKGMKYYATNGSPRYSGFGHR